MVSNGIHVMTSAARGAPGRSILPIKINFIWTTMAIPRDSGSDRNAIAPPSAPMQATVPGPSRDLTCNSVARSVIKTWGNLELLRTWLLGVALSIGFAPAVMAACDPVLNPIADPEELAYRDRGDRCEGLYVQNISTTGLKIIGYHSGQPKFAENALVLDVWAADTSTKWLQISSTRTRHYYRMDAEFAGTRFTFPLDLIRHPEIRLSPEEIAAVSCIAACDSLQPELIPTRLGYEDAAGQPYVVLQARNDLHGLHIAISDARSGEKLFDRELLQNSVWRAWRPAELPVAQFFDTTDVILVEVRSRGRAAQQFETLSSILRK